MRTQTNTIPSENRPSCGKTTAEPRDPTGVPAATWEIHHPLSESDRTLLRLVSEQRAIRVDQLARFLKRRPADLKRTLERLERGNYLNQGTFLVDEPAWVWIETTTGVWAAATGFKRYRPFIGSLLHTAAINDIRIELEREHPGGKWVCERALMREGRRGVPMPDGVLQFPRGRRHAIEAELSRKGPGVLREIIAGRCRRYEKVVYYCSHQTLPLVKRFRSEQPRLVVRSLPGLDS
jgi:hypothetical protein